MTCYNNTVHNTTGMAPPQVSVTDVLAIWQRMHNNASRVRSVRAKYTIGQLVRISKENPSLRRARNRITLPKYFELLVIHSSRLPVYELEDLN